MQNPKFRWTEFVWNTSIEWGRYFESESHFIEMFIFIEKNWFITYFWYNFQLDYFTCASFISSYERPVWLVSKSCCQTNRKTENESERHESAVWAKFTVPCKHSARVLRSFTGDCIKVLWILLKTFKSNNWKRVEIIVMDIHRHQEKRGAPMWGMITKSNWLFLLSKYKLEHYFIIKNISINFNNRRLAWKTDVYGKIYEIYQWNK